MIVCNSLIFHWYVHCNSSFSSKEQKEEMFNEEDPFFGETISIYFVETVYNESLIVAIFDNTTENFSRNKLDYNKNFDNC